MEQEDCIVPTRGMRLRLLAHWLVGIAAFLLLGWGAGAYSRHIARLPFCEGLVWTQLVVVLTCLILLTGALWAGRYAWRIATTGQMPPPGALVMFRTKIHRNWFVQLNVACSIFVSLMLAGTVAYTLFGLHLASIFVSKSECLRQQAFEQAKREACRSANASKAPKGAPVSEGDLGPPQNATSDAVRSDAQRESR